MYVMKTLNLILMKPSLPNIAGKAIAAYILHITDFQIIFTGAFHFGNEK